MGTGGNSVRTAIRNRYTGQIWAPEPGVSKDEVLLAVKDVPMTKEPGPDRPPAEFIGTYLPCWKSAQVCVRV